MKQTNDLILHESEIQRAIVLAGSIGKLCEKTKIGRSTLWRILRPNYTATYSTRAKIRDFIENSPEAQLRKKHAYLSEVEKEELE